MSDNFKGITIIENFIWKFLERTGLQIVNLLVQIVLVRLLAPKDFATIAIIMVFITIANIFIQTGFSTALIQAEKIDEKDCSTIFFSSLIISIFAFLVLWIVSPLIGAFYEIKELVWLVRGQSIIVIIGAFSTVQQAIMSRNMQFKCNFFARIIACLISGVIAILAAFNGFGIWSIIILNIVNNFIYTIVLCLKIRWMPKLIFSMESFKRLFAFSWQIMLANLIGALYDNMRTLVIGKFYNKNMLGYYNRADTVGSSLMSGITASISSIMLPVLSKFQNDIEMIKDKLRKTFAVNCYICVPIMFGMAAISENLITLLFTDKWIISANFLSIICIGYSFFPIHSANLQAIYAIGKSDVVLKLEIIKRCVGFGLIFISIPFGVYAVAISVIIFSILSILINSYPNSKYINYSLGEQINDIKVYYIMSIVMGIIVYGVGEKLQLNYIFLNLLIQIILGILLYAIQSILIKPPAYRYIVSIILDKLSNNKKYVA